MTGLKSIPDDVRWRIAAEFSARLPSLYENAFREVVGGQYDELEQEVWTNTAKAVFDIARSLSLPVSNAPELAETIRTVMVILFGPGFKSETLEVSNDSAVILIKRCPVLDASHVAGSPGELTFRRCMAFTLMAVPALNKEFGARFVRTMCTRDRQCEIKVSRTETDAKK